VACLPNVSIKGPALDFLTIQSLSMAGNRNRYDHSVQGKHLIKYNGWSIDGLGGKRSMEA
jgi:hypothetical protein